MTETVAIKLDSEKPPVSLMSSYAILEMCKVLGFGAKKYSDHNWRLGFKQSRLLDAAFRHLLAYNDGEDKDPESGLSHLAHAMCMVMFALEQERNHPELDNRYKYKRLSEIDMLCACYTPGKAYINAYKNEPTGTCSRCGSSWSYIDKNA